MNDRPQDRPEDRRRRGPLGDEGDPEETRRVPQEGEGGETRRIPPEDAEREGAARASASEDTASRTAPGEEEPETRVVRVPGAPEDEMSPYTREERLRDVYGGVDWLASFIGCVFAVVCGVVLLLLLSGLVLAPLEFTLELEGQVIDAAIITGLVIVGLALFLAYFVGGYVAGRLVRFDGGRNGAATVLWGILLSVIATLFGSFLPGALFGLLQDFVETSVLPAIGGLTEIGLTGLAIIAGALLLEFLGGFLGGRLGVRYHTRIDETT
jgi:VIT1/CCC1 family predicted Fe2+/Mn2+ transporter